MKLTELTTPYERRRVIEYGSEGNNAVRHWRMLRQVSGPLYMTEPLADGWGDLRFNLYFLYPGVIDGVIFRHDLNRPEEREVGLLAKELADMDVETADGFLRMLDRTMASGNFIGNVPIEFVRQWYPKRADEYAKYREAFYAKKHKKERAEQKRQAEEKAAEKAAKKQRRAAEDAAERALYLGWADPFTPMQFGKIHKAMEAMIRTDGIVSTKRDFIITYVKRGYVPKQDDGVTSWYKRDGEWIESKPRTEYYLSWKEFGYKISKTEFEFAKYIQEHLPSQRQEALQTQ